MGLPRPTFLGSASQQAIPFKNEKDARAELYLPKGLVGQVFVLRQEPGPASPGLSWQVEGGGIRPWPVTSWGFWVGVTTGGTEVFLGALLLRTVGWHDYGPCIFSQEIRATGDYGMHGRLWEACRFPICGN